jgi:molybdate transport system substrate-binding protein
LTRFEDLADDEVTYVVCVETAPCGKVARTLLDANGVTARPASLEVDVKAVLARVTADEADAGLVYATDAAAAGAAVEQLPVPGAEDETTTYPIATLRQAIDAGLAQEFVDLVLSEQGRQVLSGAGFGGP